MIKEEKISIKQFKDKSSNFWVNDKHYCLGEDNSILFVCGGIEDQKETEYFKDYTKRNKKVYTKRSSNIFEREEKEYTKITFGKHSGVSTLELVAIDRNYAKWLVQTTTDLKVKSELETLLKS